MYATRKSSRKRTTPSTVASTRNVQPRTKVPRSSATTLVETTPVTLHPSMTTPPMTVFSSSGSHPGHPGGPAGSQLASDAGIATYSTTSTFSNATGSLQTTTSTNISAHDSHNTPQLERSANDDISLNVAQAIKEKIVKGEYVDLSTLLVNSTDINAQKQNISFIQGQLTLESAKKTKQITSIEIWTDAFIIFTSIYCSVHTSKFQELLKYMNSVRLAAKRCSGNGWLYYDQQFRLKKGQDPTSSWALIDSELWLLYIQPKTFAQSYQSGRNMGKCYDFNYTGSCTKIGCVYEHACIRCSESHPSIYCYTKATHGFNRFSSNWRSANVTPRYRGQNYQNFRSSNSNFQTQRSTFRPKFKFNENAGFRNMGPR